MITYYINIALLRWVQNKQTNNLPFQLLFGLTPLFGDSHGYMPPQLKTFSAEVDQQIAQFGKIKTLADKAGELRETRHQLREKAQTKEDVEMSDSDSDEEIDWRQQNIFWNITTLARHKKKF